MTRSRRRGALALAGLCAAVVAGACRHVPPAPAVPVTATWSPDEHCWWTAIRTTLPVDSVGERFSRAFRAVGLNDVASQRVGDTVLVRGGPTELDDGGGRATFASRAVAYQAGDSTRFRWYSSITPRAGVAATATDSTTGSGRHIGFCGRIGKAVAISGFAPHDPTSADSAAVWGRVSAAP